MALKCLAVYRFIRGGRYQKSFYTPGKRQNNWYIRILNRPWWNTVADHFPCNNQAFGCNITGYRAGRCVFKNAA